jgi:lipopolysaccharide/colanic/teichoic acid biosynthesis glycosyltransferase
MSIPTSRRHDVPRAGKAPRPEKLSCGATVFDEELFSQLLVRERKRSERSNRPFILLSLSAKDPLNSESPRAGKTPLEALAAVIRETDILGWVKWPTVVGVIFLEIGDAKPIRAVEAIRARVYHELARRLAAEVIAHFSLEFRIYPESGDDDPESVASSPDPIFHPDLPRQERARRLSDWMKRTLDLFASVTLLVGLAPLLLVVASVVRLTSPGPVLFRQLRIGKMGKPFKMLKFRTMYVGAEESSHREFISRFIKESGRVDVPATDQLFKLTNDPRITPVGHVLRRTSIDELPQLWNVLIGEMSLVGPRPSLPYEIQQYAPWHRRRILEAKPGITGLWQVIGRSRTTFDEMVRLDLKYARTRSFWVDLWILLRTPGTVVSGKGAR